MLAHLQNPPPHTNIVVTLVAFCCVWGCILYYIQPNCNKGPNDRNENMRIMKLLWLPIKRYTFTQTQKANMDMPPSIYLAS